MKEIYKLKDSVSSSFGHESDAGMNINSTSIE